MSDNDSQDNNVSDETIEFSESHFDEDPIEPKDEVVEPTEPTAEPVEEPVDPAEETPADEEKPEGDPEAPTEPDPAESVEEKSESELKGMSREERREYFQNLQKQTKAEVEQSVDEVYQPQPIDELTQHYLDQGYSEGESLMLARQDASEQKAQIAEAKGQIAELNANMRVEAYDVMHSIDWLNLQNKETFDQDSFDAAGQLYEQLVTTDPRTGQIVDAKMSPKQFYTLIDKLRNSGSAKAQLAAQKNAERQMASAAPPTSTAPPAVNKNAEDRQAEALERALNNA